MIVAYLFSSPKGDIYLGPKDLARPFLITPETPHPSLTLGNYFDAVKACILENGGEIIKYALNDRRNDGWSLNDIQKINIRSEKHGILYHLTSIEVLTQKTRVKFTLSTAISGKAMACLLREHDVLNRLNHHFPFSFLPKIYGIREMIWKTEEGKTEKMVMLAAQWFDDYHEWHMSMAPENGKQKIQIWDLKQGPRYASTAEAFRIIEESSKILALYYDERDFSRIGAWHHAAGDFIVKTLADGRLDVKLTTVRKYDPLMADFFAPHPNPMIPMIYFFLNTTIRMRLDRLDGVGEMIWAEDFAVTAAATGFFKGLRIRESGGGSAPEIQAADLLQLLQSFDARELIRVFEPLLAHYASRNQQEAVFINAHVDDHISFLCEALQDFH